MRTLDRKLLRDLRLMWSQALTIALVVASCVGGFVTSLSAVDSLAAARDAYYAQSRFADAFAELKRAPRSALSAVSEIPGVADVQATIEHVVRLDLPGVADPMLGRLIGVDPREPARLNLLTLRSGQPLADDDRLGRTGGDGAIDALVTERFAQARGLRPGSRVGALINGRHRTLVVAGTVLSPEYVFSGINGMPDAGSFGVFWIDADALGAAYDMRGAFNRVALRLAPGASEAAVLADLERRLAAYGVRSPHGRADQPSNRMLDNEIQEQRVIGTVLPVIFLAVAAFLLNVVVSRLVSTQREQIAALKALGYGDGAIAAHYLKLVLLVAALGLALGLVLGGVLGGWLTRLYAEFFRFPVFDHRLAPWLVAVGALATAATAVAGTLNAILATVRLPPAEAMRPPAPGRYRRTLLERLGLRTGVPLRMILRHMERRPVRASLSIVGIASAMALVVMGSFVRDAIDAIMDTQFGVAIRGDVIVWMAEASDDGARHALARLPGVLAVESGRDVPVTFRNGPLAERGQVQGFDAPPVLRRIVDVDGARHAPPPDGLLMTDRLAAKLRLRPGDLVEVEVLDGRRRTLRLPLAGTVREMLGLNAYAQRSALNRWLGDGDLSSQYSLSVERGAEPALLEALHAMPRVAGVFSKATLQRNMQEISARNVRIMSTVMTAFAVVIAVGVVYNNARIALAERTWELASLRVLGFTRGEVSLLLLGELALSVAVALPLGVLLGWALVAGIAGLLASDQFLFPVVIRPATYATAALTVLAAALASALVVRRRVDRLDMVAALKTRE